MRCAFHCRRHGLPPGVVRSRDGRGSAGHIGGVTTVNQPAKRLRRVTGPMNCRAVIQRPVRSSSSSRTMSAWPAWRAVSPMTASIAHRRSRVFSLLVTGSPASPRAVMISLRRHKRRDTRCGVFAARRRAPARWASSVSRSRSTSEVTPGSVTGTGFAGRDGSVGDDQRRRRHVAPGRRCSTAS